MSLADQKIKAKFILRQRNKNPRLINNEIRSDFIIYKNNFDDSGEKIKLEKQNSSFLQFIFSSQDLKHRREIQRSHSILHILTKLNNIKSDQTV